MPRRVTYSEVTCLTYSDLWKMVSTLFLRMTNIGKAIDSALVESSWMSEKLKVEKRVLK